MASEPGGLPWFVRCTLGLRRRHVAASCVPGTPVSLRFISAPQLPVRVVALLLEARTRTPHPLRRVCAAGRIYCSYLFIKVCHSNGRGGWHDRHKGDWKSAARETRVHGHRHSASTSSFQGFRYLPPGQKPCPTKTYRKMKNVVSLHDVM